MKSKKTLIRENDRLFSKIICSGGKCEVCGKQITLQAHHWYKGKKAGGFSTRWQLTNGLCVCAGCHFRAHQSGGLFIKELMLAKGIAWYQIMSQSLNEISRQTKYTLLDIEIINNNLKEIVEELDNE